jgi:hypothetical protein
MGAPDKSLRLEIIGRLFHQNAKGMCYCCRAKRDDKPRSCSRKAQSELVLYSVRHGLATELLDRDGEHPAGKASRSARSVESETRKL